MADKKNPPLGTQGGSTKDIKKSGKILRLKSRSSRTVRVPTQQPAAGRKLSVAVGKSRLNIFKSSRAIKTGPTPSFLRSYGDDAQFDNQRLLAVQGFLKEHGVASGDSSAGPPGDPGAPQDGKAAHESRPDDTGPAADDILGNLISPSSGKACVLPQDAFSQVEQTCCMLTGFIGELHSLNQGSLVMLPRKREPGGRSNNSRYKPFFSLIEFALSDAPLCCSWCAGDDGEPCSQPLQSDSNEFHLVGVVDIKRKIGQDSPAVHLFCANHGKQVLRARRLPAFFLDDLPLTGKVTPKSQAQDADDLFSHLPFTKVGFDNSAIVRFLANGHQATTPIDSIRRLLAELPDEARTVFQEKDLAMNLADHALKHPHMMWTAKGPAEEPKGGDFAAAARVDSLLKQDEQRPIGSAAGAAGAVGGGGVVRKRSIFRNLRKPSGSSRKMFEAKVVPQETETSQRVNEISEEEQGQLDTQRRRKFTASRLALEHRAVTGKEALSAIRDREQLPMVVVPLKELLDHGHLPRSSDGLARPRKEDDVVVFVSHRWWADDHPDPNGLKYKILCRALLRLGVALKCTRKACKVKTICNCTIDYMVIWIGRTCACRLCAAFYDPSDPWIARLRPAQGVSHSRHI